MSISLIRVQILAPNGPEVPSSWIIVLQWEAAKAMMTLFIDVNDINVRITGIISNVYANQTRFTV